MFLNPFLRTIILNTNKMYNYETIELGILKLLKKYPPNNFAVKEGVLI